METWFGFQDHLDAVTDQRVRPPEITCACWWWIL